MDFNIKKKFDYFLTNNRDYPLLVGFFAGFYPLSFYYSNNYESINSVHHLLFFGFLFLVLPSVFTYLCHFVFNKIEILKPFKRHLLFVLVFVITAIFLSQVYFFTIKKKLVLLLLITVIFLSIKFYNLYKKIIVFLVLLSIIPFFKTFIIIIQKQIASSSFVSKINFENIKLIKTPNIYIIQPDGYAGQTAMESKIYNYKDTIYNWLEKKRFKVYKNSMSNYPGSLASNSSMFNMQAAYNGSKLATSPIEMLDSRNSISGNNPVIRILKNNNYQTSLILENEYFLQNFKNINYDYSNIQQSEIQYFSNFVIHKNVFEDFKNRLKTNSNSQKPNFYFIERLVPHHIVFDGIPTSIKRKTYLSAVEEANVWLAKTINLIDEKDPNAMIVIVADHGGWLGLENSEQLQNTKDKNQINSLFNNLLAIKCADKSFAEFDENLKTNVNLFRTIFAYLANKKELIKQQEPDDNYRVDH